MDIGKRLLECGEECKMSQQELADRVGCRYDASYINKVENGEEPTLDFLKEAAEILDVKPSYFLTSDKEVVEVKAAEELFTQWKQLSEEDKKSVADFLESILIEKRKRDAVSSC